jgi:hypothetical protein
MAGTALAALAVAMPLGQARADMAAEFEALKAENAELKGEVSTLKQDIKIIQKTMAKTSEAVAAPKTPPKMVTSGNENIALTVAGQVNRMVFYADDGRDGDVFFADNDYGSTRLTITGKGKITDDISISALVEAEFESNSTDRVKIQDDTPGRDDATRAIFRERKYEIIGESKTLGKVSLGQGSTASDGTAEVSLSGTGVVAGSGIDAMGALINFQQKNVANISTQTVTSFFKNFDGLSRTDRIRYDSPAIAGFTASGSYIDGDSWDAALRYKNKFGFGEIEAAASYFQSHQVNSFLGTAVSGAYETTFGTNIAGTYSMNDQRGNIINGNPNVSEYWYVMIGQDLKVIDLGETSFAIDYAQQNDQFANGSRGKFRSFTAVQQIKKASTELYFKVGEFFDVKGPPAAVKTVINDLDDIFIAALGARVKF